MPRTARASVGGICYHVLNRGNARAEVFHKDGDCVAFVELMAAACRQLPLRVLGYCLMPNHFHMVLWPLGDGDLSHWMTVLRYVERNPLRAGLVARAESWAWSSRGARRGSGPNSCRTGRLSVRAIGWLA